MERPEKDGEILNKLLDLYEMLLTENQRKAFEGMRDYLSKGGKRKLSPKQRKWASKILNQFEPIYGNYVSSGIVPRGREVETPTILRRENLPMAPPGRKKLA